MKYPAAVYVIPLCVTMLLAGCEEIPWGACGPAGLPRKVPLGVTFALEAALSPNGVITYFAQEDDEDGFYCDDVQSITHGPAYRSVFFNKEVRSASSEDIFSFTDSYIFELYCHGQGMAEVEFFKLFNAFWLFGRMGSSSEPLVVLEDYLGPDFSDCTRGWLWEYNYPEASCAIVTDKQGVTRFYPLQPDDPIWGDPQGRKIGEFSLSKEEFLEWYHNNIDLDSLD